MKGVARSIGVVVVLLLALGVPEAQALSGHLERRSGRKLALEFKTSQTLSLAFSLNNGGKVTTVNSSPQNGCGVGSAGQILCSWSSKRARKQGNGTITFTTQSCYPKGGGGNLASDHGSGSVGGPDSGCGGGTKPPKFPKELKDEARRQQIEEAIRMAVLCPLAGGGVFALKYGSPAAFGKNTFVVESNGDDVDIRVEGSDFGRFTGAAIQLCQNSYRRIRALAKIVNDPPAKAFKTVAFPAPPAKAPAGLLDCTVADEPVVSDCHALQTKITKHQAALNALERVTTALGTSADRLGGANHAGNRAAAKLQLAALKALEALSLRRDASRRSRGSALKSAFAGTGTGVDVTLDSDQMAVLAASYDEAADFPPPVSTRVAALNSSASTAFFKTFQDIADSPHAASLEGSLTKKTKQTATRKFAGTISLGELGDLTAALGKQKALGSTRKALATALKNAQRKHGAARRRALKRFASKADSIKGKKAGAGDLLAAGARELT